VIGDINDSYDNSRTSEKEIETRRKGELLLTLRLRNISLRHAIRNVVAGNSVLVY